VADQPVDIAAADPGWPARFEQERAALAEVLAPWLDGAIEHVGSTAVPGLAAKPVIDIAAPVRSIAVAREAIPVLQDLGWLHWEADPMEWRHWFLKPHPERRTHHLYLVERSHPEFANLLAVRDALRADPALAERYAAHKGELARRYRNDRNAYTNAKSGFITDLLRRVGREGQPRDYRTE
jgi:GrpB-like predicted nucleotidyltransferase (UPF0157 family)